MARIALNTTLIILAAILIGCETYDSGRGQLVTTEAGAAAVATKKAAGEIDMVEQVVVNRRAYQQSLASLAQHYTASGNNMKLDWAKKELKGLDTMPKYKYIVEAEAAGPKLKASTPIPDADRLYEEALQLQKRAELLVVFKDNDLLRLALDKYDQVIRKHPSSDKIDDAAFKAGEIYEYFKDYTIALLYYQRTYQWNPQAPYPARFRAAFILDKRLHRRAEALELYLQALQKEGKQHLEWRQFTEKRIRELTKQEEGSK